MTASITILLLVIVLSIPFVLGVHHPWPSLLPTHYLSTLPTTMMVATAAVAVAIDSATVYSTTKAATTVSTIAARGICGRQPWDIL